MICPNRDAGDRQHLYFEAVGPEGTYRCLYCGKLEEPFDGLLERARKTVAPIIERERRNEVIPSYVMDTVLR